MPVGPRPFIFLIVGMSDRADGGLRTRSAPTGGHTSFCSLLRLRTSGDALAGDPPHNCERPFGSSRRTLVVNLVAAAISLGAAALARSAKPVARVWSPILTSSGRRHGYTRQPCIAS